MSKSGHGTAFKTKSSSFFRSAICARNHLIPVTALNGVTVDLPALPMIFDSFQSLIRRQPPKMGEHTREVMEELGYSPVNIEDLIREKVIL